MEIAVCDKCCGDGIVKDYTKPTAHRNEYEDKKCANCDGTGMVYKLYLPFVTQPRTVEGLKKLSDLSNKIINLIQNGKQTG